MTRILSFLFAMILLTACGAQVPVDPVTDPNDPSLVPGGMEKGVRFVFQKDYFTDLSDYVTTRQTNFKCLGDVTTAFYVNGQDYAGVPTAFPPAAVTDDFNPSTKPAFVKNVSVDITNTYFPLTMQNSLLTDACSYRGVASAAAPTACADFDEEILVTPSPTIAPTPTPTATPTPTISPAPTPTPEPSSTPYYGTKFYRVRDDWCANQGPVLSDNPATTKTHVGGVNIDIDRAQLGASEDLLMMVTYQAYNENAAWPSVQSAQDETIFEVNLIATSLGLDLLLGAKQPRAWSDYASTAMPVYLKTIATLRDPSASLRTEQIYVPLSENSLVDRIRLERVRGSFHLYQIDLYRLGNRIGSE